KTAADILNSYSIEELTRIFQNYGEVDNSGRAARLVCEFREKRGLETTTDLNEAVGPMLPKFAEHKFLAKIYQALRIEVNGEMRSLEGFLRDTIKVLKPGGRLSVITYHSLEDRMVKNFMKSGNIDGKVAKDFFGNTESPFKIIAKKPIIPSEEEIAANTRARSAKLRIAEMI
ncbi:MAG: 16S rRNA (cytosine(1402)-N(4))-methyltransferase RsmH, partial [Bacteroidales bacterium]